jgi:hypothetical protein
MVALCFASIFLIVKLSTAGMRGGAAGASDPSRLLGASLGGALGGASLVTSDCTVEATLVPRIGGRGMTSPSGDMATAADDASDLAREKSSFDGVRCTAAGVAVAAAAVAAASPLSADFSGLGMLMAPDTIPFISPRNLENVLFGFSSPPSGGGTFFLKRLMTFDSFFFSSSVNFGVSDAVAVGSVADTGRLARLVLLTTMGGTSAAVVGDGTACCGVPARALPTELSVRSMEEGVATRDPPATAALLLSVRSTDADGDFSRDEESSG